MPAITMIHNSRTNVLGILFLAVATASGDHIDNRLPSQATEGLPRSLQENFDIDDDPRTRMSISEAYPCIPADEIRRIHQDAWDMRLPWDNGDSGAIQKECYTQQNHCGLSDAPSACCRVSFEAGWLVCDAYNAFDFMPCVCNDNTLGSPTSQPPSSSPPTASPTGSPTTRAPTVSPTDAPTVSPTDAPTISPTNAPTSVPTVSPTTASPTASPTLSPTGRLVPTGDAITDPIATPTLEPTNAPVADPTDAPVAFTDSPTRSPTMPPTTEPTSNPTKLPTSSPTTSPTVSPTAAVVDESLDRYTTESKFDADLDATIRQSQCRMDPPAIQFVQGSTFVYRYEVTRLESPVPRQRQVDSFSDIGSRLGDAISELSDDWTEALHDELAAQFLVCDGYDSDTVWILQSKPHEIDASVPCTNSLVVDISQTNDGDVGESPNDADSNDSPSSCVTVTAEARIIAYRSPIGEKTTKQVWDTTSYEEGAVSDNFSMEAVAFLEDVLNAGNNGLLAPTFATVYVGGQIVDGSTGTTTDGDSSSSSNNNNAGDSGTEDDGTDPADQGTPDTDGGDGTSLWSDTTGGTAVGIESSANNNTSPTNSWMSPGAVATIAVVSACLLILLMLAAIRRNKRDGANFREDEEYLREAGAPKSDYYSGRPVNHLDLSESDDDGAGPIIRSDLDLEGNNKTNHRGRLAIGSKAQSSPKHFHFSGFSSGVPSPRERSKMGPLNLADEFREGNSDRTSIDETTTGTHRGGVTNSSSSSNHRGIVSNSSMSSNHRGIVANSSSMSSNLPPPHQNTSPRLYQLRDTVKL